MVAANQHILMENISPTVDGGLYAAKFIQGETCVVEADVFRDGHETLQVGLRWRNKKSAEWKEIPMTQDGNDRWRANFHLNDVGAYEFQIRATGNEPPMEQSSAVFSVTVDRPVARFGSWYEMFVRSQGTDPKKIGTFKDAETRLGDIKAMGFDVLYLAPIHPIGRTARKGPNNSLNAGANDPGSPWAVGNETGGHTAVEPSLGTLAEFDHFVTAAKSHGLEIALDFAPHCSPDHPWVNQHPDWFYHRADGSIKCHENPPYKYEDIYPLNFDTSDQKDLFAALRDVFLFWIGHGVTLFRVDNPHTKPLFFWEWVIREVKNAHPEVIFLAEAFTRPKMMMALSKAGFSQSYTYFMWRTSKAELTNYLTELTKDPVPLYFRPNFFVTTPDVLPSYLQTGGRAAFEIRAALAATLSPSFGIINGFELCENAALHGTEEYADSEKFQVRVRDWNQKGNIKETLKKLNRIRKENVAFQTLASLTFVTTDNDRILSFVRMSPDRSNILVVMVNLDPHHSQQTTAQIPMDKLGLSWEAGFDVQELTLGSSGRWARSVFWQSDPKLNPFQIFRIKK